MANCGEKNTNGSQFYITLSKLHWLNKKHVVFGEVIEGKEIVDKLESLGTNSGVVEMVLLIKDCGEVNSNRKKKKVKPNEDWCVEIEYSEKCGYKDRYEKIKKAV